MLAVGGSLAVAVLAAIPAGQAKLGPVFRGAGHMLLLSPGRSIAGSLVILAGVAVLIVFFPVSTFWAMLFGFWLPVLVAMQIFFPVLRRLYELDVGSPRNTARTRRRPDRKAEAGRPPGQLVALPLGPGGGRGWC